MLNVTEALRALSTVRTSLTALAHRHPRLAPQLEQLVLEVDALAKVITFPAACMRCAPPCNATLIHNGEPLCGTHALEVLDEEAA